MSTDYKTPWVRCDKRLPKLSIPMLDAEWGHRRRSRWVLVSMNSFMSVARREQTADGWEWVLLDGPAYRRDYFKFWAPITPPEE